MKKKLLVTLAISMLLVGCGNNDIKPISFDDTSINSEELSEFATTSETIKESTKESSSLQEFENIIFNDETIDYDGEYHSIKPTNVPSFAKVSYLSTISFKNPSKDPYIIQIKITAPNYKALVLEAKLYIVGKDLEGIELKDLTVEYDGKEHYPYPINMPEGAKAYPVGRYKYTEVNEEGYDITYQIEKEGYYPLTLTSKLYITSLKFQHFNFEDHTFFYIDEDYVFPLIDDNGYEINLRKMPYETSLKYECTNDSKIENVVHDVGEYNLKATLSNPNHYETKVYESKINIIDPYKFVSSKDEGKFTFDNTLTYQKLNEELAKGNFSMEILTGDEYENVIPSYVDKVKNRLGDPRYIYSNGESCIQIAPDYMEGASLGSVSFIYKENDKYIKGENDAYGIDYKEINDSSYYNLLDKNTDAYFGFIKDFFTEGENGELVPSSRKSGTINYYTDPNFTFENNEFIFSYRAMYFHPEFTHYEIAKIRIFNIGNTTVNIPDAVKYKNS